MYQRACLSSAKDFKALSLGKRLASSSTGGVGGRGVISSVSVVAAGFPSSVVVSELGSADSSGETMTFSGFLRIDVAVSVT